ncbi:MAG: hypothetical protein JW803_06030 [Endomicrobiales bacterium]|nr:hypothetical protein [Endomicrobiales bacterium]
MKNILIPMLCVTILAIIIFISVVVYLFIKYPIGMHHLLNPIIDNQNLYEPIVKDDFSFHDRYSSKQYTINPRYIDIYEIGIMTKTKGIPSTYKFEGKIKAVFYCQNKLVFETSSQAQLNAYYTNNLMNYYKSIVLLKFNIPLVNKYRDNITVKITILEPDIKLKAYKDDIYLYIAVSGVP